MLPVMLFLFVIALVPALLLLGGKRDDPRKLIAARFAALRVGGAAALPDVIDDLLKSKGATSGGWSDRFIRRIESIARLNKLQLQANSLTPIRRLLLQCAGTATIAMLAALTLLPAAIALFIGAAAGYLPVMLLKIRRKRRIAAMDKALPEVIDMLSRALRAGHSLPVAISIIAEQAAEPAKTEFSEIFRKQKFGLPLRDALLQLLDRIPSEDLRVLITGILVQRDTGGNLTQILDRTATVIRERLKLQGDIRVHTAQGRMTGWILCLLPIVMLVFINLINPGYSRALTADPLGRKCLYLGIVLLITGALLIKRIVGGIEV